jgi:hypothetical protein
MVRKPAAEEVDVAVVARGLDVARDGRAVHGDEQRHPVRHRPRPCLDNEGNVGIRIGRAEFHKPIRVGVGMFRERSRANGTKPSRLHRLRVRAGGLQQFRSLLAGDVPAVGAFKPRARDDLPGPRAGAAVEAGDQFAHRPLAAGIE